MNRQELIQQDYTILWRTIDALTTLMGQVEDPDLRKYLEKKRTLLYMRIQEYEHSTRPSPAGARITGRLTRRATRRI